MEQKWIIHLDHSYEPAIENHPILNLPPEDRFADKELLDEFSELLLKFMGVYKYFFQGGDGYPVNVSPMNMRNAPADEPADAEDAFDFIDFDDPVEGFSSSSAAAEISEQYLKESRKKNSASLDSMTFLDNEYTVIDRFLHGKLAYDNIAFLNARDYQLKNYSKEKIKSFCGAFMNIYKFRFKDSAEELITVINDSSTKEQRFFKDKIKPIENILKTRGLKIEDLTYDEQCAIAKQCRTSHQKLMNFAKTRQALEIGHFESGSGNQDENSSMEYNFADPFAANTFDSEEQIETLILYLDKILDADMKEFPRLFFNWGLLKTLKEADGPNAAVTFSAYKAREDDLLEKVFLRLYLEFVLVQPPEPDSIPNLYRAKYKPQMDQRDRSIADYVNATSNPDTALTPQTVKNRYQTFKRAFHYIIEK